MKPYLESGVFPSPTGDTKMAKHERDRVAVGEESSKGTHGGNRGQKDEGREWSNPKAGKDPHKGGRPAPSAEESRKQH
jgi:hypothetical protein